MLPIGSGPGDSMAGCHIRVFVPPCSCLKSQRSVSLSYTRCDALHENVVIPIKHEHPRGRIV